MSLSGKPSKKSIVKQSGQLDLVCSAMPKMQEKKYQISYTVIVGLVILAGFVDLGYDIAAGHPEEGLGVHHLVEVSLLIAAMLSVVFLWVSMSSHLARTRKRLASTEEELQQFREKHSQAIEGMQRAIHSQFLAWGFTESEARIADLLLRGHSTRTIAERLGKREKTIRNQTTAVYEKSGKTGRSDLAAFFLGNILGE